MQGDIGGAARLHLAQLGLLAHQRLVVPGQGQGQGEGEAEAEREIQVPG